MIYHEKILDLDTPDILDFLVACGSPDLRCDRRQRHYFYYYELGVIACAQLPSELRSVAMLQSGAGQLHLPQRLIRIPDGLMLRTSVEICWIYWVSSYQHRLG